MSDSDIELGYEQDLQAEPTVRLYVNGSLKRVEPNTPVGRDVIEKAAMLWSLKSDDVEVRSAGHGAGGEPRTGFAEPHETPRGERASTEASVFVSEPAPNRCCKPRMYAGPSGLRYRHEWNCRAKLSGQVYEGGAVVDLPRARMARRHAIETRHYGLDDAMAAHPAGGVLRATSDACPAHPLEGVWDCPACSEREVGP